MLDSTVHDNDYDDCDDAAIMLVVVILVDAQVCNHDIRYLMFNTITAAAAYAMMIMVVMVVIMVTGTDNDYA